MAINSRLAMNDFKQVYKMSLYQQNSPEKLHQSDSATTSLEYMFGKVLMSGYISLTERQLLQSILLSESVSDEHHAIINRLLYGVRRGFIKMSY